MNFGKFEYPCRLIKLADSSWELSAHCLYDRVVSRITPHFHSHADGTCTCTGRGSVSVLVCSADTATGSLFTVNMVETTNPSN